MPTDRPLISILMAVYNPKIDWFREQLESLNSQTYPNLRLYIRDDCSSNVSFTEIYALVEQCITKFPYQITQNKQNIGSNLTFEQLTREAEGEYFAYCDQDDVWLPQKLDVLENSISESGALLVCSDMFVIDGTGKITADSITKIRRHHIFHSGEGLVNKLLFRNFVTGCTMLINGEIAKQAIPFCPYMVHDHYLALWCAEYGSILSINKSLIQYRIHENNQTNMMAGVRDKKSYGEIRIRMAERRFLWLKDNFPCKRETRVAIDRGLMWTQARWMSWNHRGGMKVLWRCREINKLVSIAELCLKYVPDSIFMRAMYLVRNNRV